MTKSMKKLLALYFAIWITPLVLGLLYVSGLTGSRHAFFSEMTTYIIQFLIIVISFMNIYFSLKLFTFKSVSRSIRNNPEKNLQIYINWNIFRYICYILLIVANLFIYYSTETGDVCLAITGALLLASCFCFPSESECRYIITAKEEPK